MPEFDTVLTPVLNLFTVPLKIFEILGRIIDSPKTAPKKFPRYIQCGIQRARERLFQTSTSAHSQSWRLGNMQLSRGPSGSDSTI